MSDEIEELFAGLRKAMQRREQDAWKEGFASGEKSAIDNIIAGAMALRKASAEHPPQVTTFPVHFPPEAPDAAFLRQTLAERLDPDYDPFAEEEDIEPKIVPLAEMPKLECAEHDYRSAMLSGGFACIHCGHPEPAASPEYEPVEPPVSEGELEDLADLFDNSPAEPAAATKSEDPADLSTEPAPVSSIPVCQQNAEHPAAPVKSGPDRPMGERPAAPVPAGPEVYWTPARYKLLRETILSMPTEAELLAAFPEKSMTAITAACYSQSLPAPNKTRLAEWAMKRQLRDKPTNGHAEEAPKPTGPTIRVTVDEVINKLRMAGDVAYTTDSPLFTLFEVNGKSMTAARCWQRRTSIACAPASRPGSPIRSRGSVRCLPRHQRRSRRSRGRRNDRQYQTRHRSCIQPSNGRPD
jgi:hypothetical protein